MVFWGIFFMDSFNSYFIRMMVLGLKRIKKGKKLLKHFIGNNSLKRIIFLGEGKNHSVFFLTALYFVLIFVFHIVALFESKIAFSILFDFFKT